MYGTAPTSIKGKEDKTTVSENMKISQGGHSERSREVSGGLAANRKLPGEGPTIRPKRAGAPRELAGSLGD